MEQILVDENGYKQYLDEIEKLKQLSLKNLTAGSEAYQDAVGDGWHDNFAFEESMRESRTLAKKIDDMLSKKKYLKIVNDKKNQDVVNIGDIVEVEIKYAEDDIEIEKIMLTGNFMPNTNDGIQEITLNSPLGKVLWKTKIGKSISYCVNNQEFFVKIISKIL